MDLDPVLLSRLQFAWVIGWHILLPAFTVGMASYIAILEAMHLVTGRDVPYFLASVRRWRGDRRDHALPIRHQLEPFRRHGG
jgi:cytochrome bd-type quinol oxidase subunit 1